MMYLMLLESVCVLLTRLLHFFRLLYILHHLCFVRSWEHIGLLH